MSYKSEDTRSDLIDRVVNHVLKMFPEHKTPLIKKFVKQYYMGVSAEDMSNRNTMDLYGAVVSHWSFIYCLQPHETKVRVYNPQLEKNGWQSTHTVIEILTEDKPFLLESVRMALNKFELNMHLVIYMGGLQIARDAKGEIVEIVSKSKKEHANELHFNNEGAIYIEIDRQTDPKILDKITTKLYSTVEDVDLVVQDWKKMHQKMREVISGLTQTNYPSVKKKLFNESVEFLDWLLKDNFTFLGYREYRYEPNNGGAGYYSIPNTGLGLLSERKKEIDVRSFSKIPAEAVKSILDNKCILTVSKTNTQSTIHRPAYTDSISVKSFDENGVLVGESRFIGLYTSTAYNSSTMTIPFVKDKVKEVLRISGFVEKSHEYKTLLNILETFPRDDLFHASVDELYYISTGILRLQERQRIKLFMRKDLFGRFYSCLVFVPREQFDSELRQKFQAILMKSLRGNDLTFSTRFSESILTRVHFLIHTDKEFTDIIDVEKIEKKLIEAARTWEDDLKDALIEQYGEEQGNDLYKKYKNTFPAGYKETFAARLAVLDIGHIESLSSANRLALSVYSPIEDKGLSFRVKLFRKGKPIALSDVIPILENLGFRIISERPYKVHATDSKMVWINDYRMVHPKGLPINIEALRLIFSDAMHAIWNGECENDKLNKLIINAFLHWREVAVLRTYLKYIWQVGSPFSQVFIEDTLNNNPDIAKALVSLFSLKFDPAKKNKDPKKIEEKVAQIEAMLENVAILSEDKILRRFMGTIQATIRTNFFTIDNKSSPKEYISIKLKSELVPEIPSPKPLFEIFVYSPYVEGIHLRGAKVARGGIRWSDRKEDYRTEVLGLMKAQQVKNSVIVPMGAKGGFFVKNIIDTDDRDIIQKKVISGYQAFIKGLLDITDNLQGENILRPNNVIAYDDNDPYLVVAADKGTASFSDIANAISAEYNFWLGDAFASGGSNGYDHKKLAITARGAWESVIRHFQTINIDINEQAFTVLGIGDMAGDVFGNGMLLSRKIKLVFAFNHMHLFFDPDPNPETSFDERYRLFNLPRSQWSDYDTKLISPGGGIHLRSAKFIVLTPEMQAFLQTTETRLSPTEVIHKALQAHYDLLWNGGIGTFVKGTNELNHEVGDRTNDQIRINGKELNCLVVGEGGNLGFTQFGRIEYALKGGIINTDFIDNSGGVNCSDNEVNIKILLNDLVKSGELTEKQRNKLLADMQNEVAELVLSNNRKQNESISSIAFKAKESISMHERLIDDLVSSGFLNREIEFLPDKEELNKRSNLGYGLTRPEIAVLLSYTKNLLKIEVLKTTLPKDPFIGNLIKTYFPKVINEKYHDYLSKHRLAKEIVSTQLTNMLVDEMGITFVSRLMDETGANYEDIIKTFIVVREIFEINKYRNEILEASNKVESEQIFSLLHELNRLIRRSTRWFLRNRRINSCSVKELISEFKPRVNQLKTNIKSCLKGYALLQYEDNFNKLIKNNAPVNIAGIAASFSPLFATLDIVEATFVTEQPVDKVAITYFTVGDKLELVWLREQIKSRMVSNYWEALARGAFRDDIDNQQRRIAVTILNEAIEAESFDTTKMIDLWATNNKSQIDRWNFFMLQIKEQPQPEFTMFSVALRELVVLANSKLSK